MPDRPNDKNTDEPEKRAANPSGGWRSPNETSAPGERNAWRTPGEEETPSESWRVPTLPRDLDVKSERQGAWHLPQPGDTPYSPDHESVITPESTQQPAAADGETIEQEVLPFDGSNSESQGLEALDEDEDDSFSMSELVALASLVDNVPSVEVQPSHSTSEVPAVSATEQAAGTADGNQPLDPAEYARRELARLQAQNDQAAAVQPDQPAAASATPQDSVSTGIVSPEAYARQQLERLGAANALPQPQALVPAATGDAQSTLADKFRQAESSIRALRQQYQSGALTRDQFQTELRRLMVLDDSSVWWMMGVESDRWYRHENGQWIPATPPALASSPANASTGQPGAAELRGAVEAVPADDLGNEGDRTVPTSPITEWIPRRVPVSDPDFTVPGTGGIYLDSAITADTMPMATVPSNALSGETVPNPAIQMQYDSVSSPMSGAADQAPSYDAEEASPTYEDAVTRQRQRTVRTVAIIAAVGAALLFIVGAIGAIGIVLYYNSLASPYRDAIAGLASYQPQFRTARILAADGSLIAQLSSPQGGLRDEVTLSQISPEMVHALVSVENERFFEDPGWDPVAITRAFVQNISSGEIVSGASTITQEIARNLILQDTTVSAERKLQEIVIAAEIARTYDKNFILELYLNEFFFGNQSYGVEAASQFYFGHSAADLNLPEAAMLAGILQAPARYDPVINREAAFERMDVVLDLMASVGCLNFSFAPYNTTPGFCVSRADITSPRVVLQKAQVETRQYQPRQFTVKYPHFVNFVQQQIENNFGTSEMFRRGFEIRTTLIPRIQDTAQNALEAQVDALAANGVNTGSVMVTDPRDGAIRAMIGSPDFSDNTIDGQVNNAFTWQQPGSSIKLVEYIGALEGVNRNGVNDYYTPASVLWDVPTTFE
ncbi:MAG: transglycosylase domain-containing protein, partial [Chloroflexota bacterium]